MSIIINLDVMMAKLKMSLNELSDKVGLNLSILKTGKARAIYFSTLNVVLCKVLQCQLGDILEYTEGDDEESAEVD